MTDSQNAANNLCQKCCSAEKKYYQRGSDPNCFVIHAERLVITTGGKKNPEYRKQKKSLLDRLEKRVAALKNTHGGVILVHLNGQDRTDRCLEYFDEFICNPFTDLIEDGKLFVETYVRQWLSVISGLEDYFDFVLINVRKTNGIATVDFCTKTCNDCEKKNPSALNILSILSQRYYSLDQEPKIRGLPAGNAVHKLHESRDTELKAFMPADLNEVSSRVDKFIDYVWVDLKLRDNLTSLSKVDHGGSFYVGIQEGKRRLNKSYETKYPDIHGLELKLCHDTVKRYIWKKIEDNVSVLNLNGTFGDAPLDLVKIEFHRVPNIYPQKFVLEVAVRHFDGIVFYDKEGPRTYLIRDGFIVRMDRCEWIRRIRYNLPPWNI